MPVSALLDDIGEKDVIRLSDGGRIKLAQASGSNLLALTRAALVLAWISLADLLAWDRAESYRWLKSVQFRGIEPDPRP